MYSFFEILKTVLVTSWELFLLALEFSKKTLSQDVILYHDTCVPMLSPCQLQMWINSKKLNQNPTRSKLLFGVTQKEIKIPRNVVGLFATSFLFQEPPYMMLKKNSAFLTGNDRFEGYVADMIARLAAGKICCKTNNHKPTFVPENFVNITLRKY